MEKITIDCDKEHYGYYNFKFLLTTGTPYISPLGGPLKMTYFGGCWYNNYINIKKLEYYGEKEHYRCYERTFFIN